MKGFSRLIRTIHQLSDTVIAVFPIINLHDEFLFILFQILKLFKGFVDFLTDLVCSNF